MSYTFTQTGSEIQAILDRAEAGGQIDQDIAAKQDQLTFDAVPTEGSTNPAESGGIYDAIQAGGAAALAAFATDSVTPGDVVSFPDGADNIPVKSFVGSIIPVQDLHGQSAPYPAGGGKNKYNDATTTAGEWIAADGTIGSSSAFALSDYIPISGASVTISGNTGGWGSSPAVCFFDSSKNYISGTHPTTNPVTLTIPSGAAYLRTSLSATSRSTLQVELGSTASDFAPYANICPISGWTEANITRAGRNLFNPHPNHNVNAQGEYIAAGAQYWATDYIPIGDTKSVVVSVADLGGMTDGSIVRVAYASDGTVSAVNVGYFDHYTTPWTFTLADNIVGLRFRGYRSGGAAPITGAKIQVEFGGSASTYHAYQADTILLDFGQTVYAGTLTALGGGLWQIQPTHKAVDMGSLSWTYDSVNTRFWSDGVASEIVKPSTWGANALCSMFGGVTANPSNGHFSIYASGRVYVKDTQYTTAAAFTTAVTGQTFLYQLATLPDPITITGEDLQTLLGANTVWTDVGSVTGMTYRADTALYIQKLLNGGGTLQTLSMASPSPSLSLGRVGVLAEPEEAEPEQMEEEAEQLEQTEEPEQTEEA